jgi:ribonuclease HI
MADSLSFTSKKYYAVKIGRIPGIYTNWTECKQQIHKFSNAKYKSFTTLQQAKEYLGLNINSITKTSPLIQANKINTKPTIVNDETSINLIGYTDGSCIDETGGSGIVLLQNNNVIGEWSIMSPEQPTTNNRAELQAILHLLTLIVSIKFDQIIIRSDSKYSINCITKWINTWKQNSWKTANGRPVSNVDLIRVIDTMINLLSERGLIIFEHVYGHRGEIYNERADQLANLARANKYS